ncbi:MAG: phytoene desaturase family protein [Armatimonadota bacterium]
MANSVIIVGAGIAGLSAGCYARMNGYRAAIFEMHNIPGGLCTAWTRKGYTWDISMHLLAGSKTGPLHRMWRELGAVQHRRYHYHDVLTRVEDGGKSVAFCADLRQLEEQMLALSPGDARRIREFLRIFGGKSIVHLLPLDAPGTGSRLSALKMLFGMLPLLGAFRKYGKLTLREFADGFQDPFLRAAIPNILDHPGWPMPGYPLMGVAGFHTSALTEAGVPIGGSKGVIEDIANRFKRLGGELQCRCKVTEVIVENDRAVGIRLEDGTEHRANIVLWAADGRTLLFDLLGERYLTDELRTRYREWQVVRSMVHVMLGLKRDMRQEPCRLTFKVDQPITVGETTFPWLYFMHHGFDPTSAGGEHGGRGVVRYRVRLLGKALPGQARLRGGEAPHRGRDGRHAGQTLARPGRRRGGGGRAHPGHLSPLHRQLAGLGGRLVHHAAEHGPARHPHAARPAEPLHGRPVDRALHRHRDRGVDWAAGDTAAVQGGGEAVSHDRGLNSWARRRPAPALMRKV